MTVSIEIYPRMHGFNASLRNALARLDGQTNRPPGPLDEYPSRVEHARAHRLRSEIRRRDRRRARTGRAPIRPATYPKRRPLLPLAMRQQVSDLVVSRDRALRRMQDAINTMVVPMREAMAALGHAFEQIAQPMTDFARTARTASGGFISAPRDPDDDTIPVWISPGEVWASPAMIRRHGSLLRALNGPGESILHPLSRDVTHHDRWLGEGALDRDETSGRHSLDSSGTGAVWSDLITRIDELIEVTHRCPIGDASDTSCCDRLAFELPHTDRITEDPNRVTCGGRAAQRRREAAARDRED